MSYLVVLFLLLATQVEAKSLCVNTLGNDSNTYAANTASGTTGSGTSCWSTPYRAAHGVAVGGGSDNGAEAAQAGDIVYIAAGTYVSPATNSRLNPSLNTANSGSGTGNLIRFIGSGTVTLQTNSGSGPTFGCYLRNYVSWEGLTVYEVNAPSTRDTGPFVGWDSIGCQIVNGYIDAGGVPADNGADNHPGIRLEACSDCIIRNTKVTNVDRAVGVNINNAACVQIYKSERFLIENNEFWNCGSGVFVKGGPWTGARMQSGSIRYNLIHDIKTGGGTGIAIHAGAPALSSNPTLVYQNIIYNAESGLRLWWFGGADDTNDPRFAVFRNNSIDQTTQCIEFAGTPYTTNTTGLGHVFANNICSRQTNGVTSNELSLHQDLTEIVHTRTIFYSTSGTNVILNGGGTNLTFAQWQSAPYNQDANMSTSDPLFTNPATRVYTLQNGSFALTHGRAGNGIGGADGTTIPAGAYITGSETIGTGATGGSSPATGGNGTGGMLRFKRFQ